MRTFYGVIAFLFLLPVCLAVSGYDLLMREKMSSQVLGFIVMLINAALIWWLLYEVLK